MSQIKETLGLGIVLAALAAIAAVPPADAGTSVPFRGKSSGSDRRRRLLGHDPRRR
jgi:hypothetical protein